jgi:hypothetical protein
VNYAALDVEELGSVYESLLEFHPDVAGPSNAPTFDLLVAGGERRSTGSYYTPPQLVGELVRSALEPALAERLRGARTPQQKERAILSMKVCDPACGSGHFLLAAARRLGKELARARTGEDEPAPERVREAIRDVVTHCIYGVDKNPLAVELCRVALWLESHTAGKPLTFLDHRIRCGDSLVGIFDLDVLKRGIPDEAFKPVRDDDKPAARDLARQNRTERAGQSTLFAGRVEAAFARLGTNSPQLDAIPDDTPEAIRRKKQIFERSHAGPEYLRRKQACDLWTAAFFQPFRHGAPAITSLTLADHLSGHPLDGRILGQAEALATKQRFFHWPLELPEVVSLPADSSSEARLGGGGFDVVIGNPPFMGGLKISGAFGDKYRHWLTTQYVPFGNRADLCAVLFRRAFQGIKTAGRLGMIATNTIGQGDTRQAGLASILRTGGTIAFARRFVKWPGQANVEVNLVALAKGGIGQQVSLDGMPADFISSRLDPEPEAEPQGLLQNEDKAFIADNLHGIGFVVEGSEAELLLARDPRNADCLFPYLSGEDLNSDPRQRPSRWVICFHDWDLDRARQYPDLLKIVEERVRPGRERLVHPRYQRARSRWWLFVAYGKGWRRAIAPLGRVLGRSMVSEMHALAFVPKGWVYSMMVTVFAFDDYYYFALLQSSAHEAWVRRNASTMRTDIRYTPTDCFDTFAFPQAPPQDLRVEAERLGKAYHEHRRQVMLARQASLQPMRDFWNASLVRTLRIRNGSRNTTGAVERQYASPCFVPEPSGMSARKAGIACCTKRGSSCRSNEHIRPPSSRHGRLPRLRAVVLHRRGRPGARVHRASAGRGGAPLA